MRWRSIRWRTIWPSAASGWRMPSAIRRGRRWRAPAATGHATSPPPPRWTLECPETGLLKDRRKGTADDQQIRIGELEDSTLRARKLTETTKRMIASPGYFEKFGRPQKIDDLNEHKLLHYSNQASGNVWKVTAPSGEKRQVRTAGWLSVNDGQSLLNACVAGLGIAYRGKPVAREAAQARIEACGLTAALYMQGYRRDEFAR